MHDLEKNRNININCQYQTYATHLIHKSECWVWGGGGGGGAVDVTVYAVEAGWLRIATKLKLRDHQNSAIDTGSPVKIFFDCR